MFVKTIKIKKKKKESASDGEDGFEHLEWCEESDNALEDQTEACDQQSKQVFEVFEKWILSPNGGKKMQGQLRYWSDKWRQYC